MAGTSRRTFLATAAAVGLSGGLTPRFSLGQEKSTKPKFHCGLVTYNVAKDWDLATIIDVCKKSGIEGVELRTTHKHAVEPTLSKDERDKVKKQFADSGVMFFSMGSACEYHSDNAATVKKNIEETKQ